MIDFNDPHVWNAIVSLLGGTTIALGERLLIRHTGPWAYSSHKRFHNPSQEEKKGYAHIRQCVDVLEEVEKGRNIGSDGEKLDIRALRRRKILEKIGKPIDEDIFHKTEQSPFPAIDYIVCYSNTDTAEKGAVEARKIASPLVYSLRNRNKRVKAYAIGTDLVRCAGVSIGDITGIPRQSGYNLNQAIADLCSARFQNPTYLFFIMESSSTVTDPEHEPRARRALTNHNNIVPVFIEIGKPHPPFSLRKMSRYLDAVYVQVPNHYNAAVAMIKSAFEDAGKRMKEVIN